MGIGQLGVDDELEVAVVFTLLPSELNVPGEGGSLEVSKPETSSLLSGSRGGGRLDPQKDRRNEVSKDFCKMHLDFADCNKKHWHSLHLH